MADMSEKRARTDADFGTGEIRRKIRLNITSSIDSSGDEEATTQSGIGSMTLSGGAYTLRHRYITECGEECRELYSYRDGELCVTKMGAIDTKMRFCLGGSTNTVYSVGGMRFDMQIDTLRLDAALTNSGGEIILEYSMLFGADARKCKMKIEIEAI